MELGRSQAWGRQREGVWEKKEEPEMGPSLGDRHALQLSFPMGGFTPSLNQKTAPICPRFDSFPPPRTEGWG